MSVVSNCPAAGALSRPAQSLTASQPNNKHNGASAKSNWPVTKANGRWLAIIKSRGVVSCRRCTVATKCSKSLGIKSLGIKSLGIKSLGIKSLGIVTLLYHSYAHDWGEWWLLMTRANCLFSGGQAGKQAIWRWGNQLKERAVS
jgi:hypothetical protein